MKDVHELEHEQLHKGSGSSGAPPQTGRGQPERTTMSILDFGREQGMNV